MQQYWYNETTYESYVYRPDIAGGGVPLEADGQPRSGFVLMPEDWVKPPLPPAPPSPNCNEWRLVTRDNFKAVFAAVQAVDLFSATTLVNLIMGLPAGDIPNMITLWNEAMSAIDVVPLSADFVAIEAAAVTHNIPLQFSSAGVISMR